MKAEGSKRASQAPGSHQATASKPGSGGKRADYSVDRIVREATAQLGAVGSSAPTRSLRHELRQRLEDALAGVPPDSSGAGDSEGPVAAALKRLGIQP